MQSVPDNDALMSGRTLTWPAKFNLELENTEPSVASCCIPFSCGYPLDRPGACAAPTMAPRQNIPGQQYFLVFQNLDSNNTTLEMGCAGGSRHPRLPRQP